ncbi:peptidase family M48-domain-containing protein [Aspergillus alliaceus]|uniref:Peptidase family M48-domain-containing protein n=1 Tax=Petromyces alliaceus TaxID=209559 RepID=A0A5N7CE41_PETAA|nr:peptidase family M48-domain-containing protein [Aspergillus alliaceus]
MFPLPIRHTFLRGLPRSSTASLRRIPSFTSRSSLPRSISTWLLPRNGNSIKLSNTLPRVSFTFRGRPFSTTRGSRYRGNRYNRFDGPRHDSLLIRLLQDAKPHHFIIVGLGISGFYIYNTDTVEMTGRRRFNCISAQRELAMGKQSYEEVLNEARGRILPEHHPITMQVSRVLQRLIPQAPIEGADWKVHVIKDDDMLNAFVLPGGKVFVYTGILPICRDEDGLAAVLGHEIAHVVAHHPAERMSNNIITMGAAFFVSIVFDISGQFSSMLLNLVHGLPNSRTQEAEADEIGLMMMSRACFNPEAAVRLWARMQEAEQGAPPQFLSTHPSSYNRMEAIRGWSIKAEAAYEDSGCHAIGGFGKYQDSDRQLITTTGDRST